MNSMEQSDRELVRSAEPADDSAYMLTFFQAMAAATQGWLVESREVQGLWIICDDYGNGYITALSNGWMVHLRGVTGFSDGAVRGRWRKVMTRKDFNRARKDLFGMPFIGTSYDPMTMELYRMPGETDWSVEDGDYADDGDDDT